MFLFIEHNYTRRTSLDGIYCCFILVLVFLSDLRNPSESDPIIELAIQDKLVEVFTLLLFY